MHHNTRRRRENRERLLAAATRNIAEHGYTHTDRTRLMDGSGLAANSVRNHFPQAHVLLATLCERHARALADAAGCHDPDDPAPPRAALAAAAARVLARIDACADAHTILMRDAPCLPPAARAGLAHIHDVATLQVQLAWAATRPDLAPERTAALARTLRALLLRWPDWREPGALGHPRAAADRAVAMVEATIDRLPPPAAPAPPPAAPNPHAHWMSDAAAARCTVVGPPPRHDPRDTAPENGPIRHDPRDAPRHDPRDTPANPAPAPEPAPAHPGLALRDALERAGLTPTRAAAGLGISRQRLHQLTRGTRLVTADTALRLEALLGERAEAWMARQARHDLDTARRLRDASGDGREGQGAALDPPGASRPWTGVV